MAGTVNSCNTEHLHIFQCLHNNNFTMQQMLMSTNSYRLPMHAVYVNLEVIVAIETLLWWPTRNGRKSELFMHQLLILSTSLAL